MVFCRVQVLVRFVERPALVHITYTVSIHLYFAFMIAQKANSIIVYKLLFFNNDRVGFKGDHTQNCCVTCFNISRQVLSYIILLYTVLYKSEECVFFFKLMYIRVTDVGIIFICISGLTIFAFYYLHIARQPFSTKKRKPVTFVLI